MRVNVPSERKFEVFHAIQTQHMTRRQAARRFGISPTRVQQMLADVDAFVRQHGDEDLIETSPEKLELVSLRFCYARLSHFYAMLMRKYNSLEGSSLAQEVRLLQAAARMSVEQTKVVARISKVQQAMIEAGTLTHQPYEVVREDDEEENVADAPAPAQEAACSPPAEGCTEEDDELTEAETRALTEVFANLGPDASSEQVFQELVRLDLLKVFDKTPVHPQANDKRTPAA